MNNQEAIKILGQYDVSNIHFYTTDGEEIPFTEWSDAIEMAISALQAQEAKNSNESSLTQKGLDTISRQAAIDALDKRFDKIPMEQTAEILKLRKDLRGLPSIKSEQKRGRWIYGEDEYGIDGYHCDKCGFFVPWDYAHKFINYIEDYKFCPNCGADMRGEQ